VAYLSMNKTLAVTTAVVAVLTLGAGACTDDRRSPAAPDPGSPVTSDPGMAAPAAAAEPVKSADKTAAPVAPAGGAMPPARAAFDPRNSAFTVEGRSVRLRDGVSTAPSAPGSASSVTVRYLGSEARGDLNNDGREDRAFVVTRDGGGSGTFYYVVAAIVSEAGYRTTNAFPVGDRVDIQSLNIPRNSNELHVNFARRRPGEPMTARPTADAVLLLKVTPQGVLQGLRD
jgi:hypothetical protein